MEYIFFIMLLLVPVFSVWRVWTLQTEVSRLKADIHRLERERTEEEECLVHSSGLEDHNRRLQEIKDKRKEKIVVFIRERGGASRGEVAELLDMSSSTAGRYLEELEKDGRVLQNGNTGRGVTYILNTSNTV